MFGVILLIQSLAQAHAETFWDGLVTYNPPIPMAGGTEAGNAGVPITGFELRSEGTTNGYAQVTFQISSITVLFNRDMPKEEIKTVADLKKFVDASLRGDPRATNYSTALVKFDGRDAVVNTRPISNAGPSKWYHGVSFFWRQNSVWLRSSIFSVHVTAEKRATFDKLVASLQTVKIRTPPPVKLAKDGTRLGITQAETRNLCGEPLDVTGLDEIYITEKYLIEVRFDAANSDKLALISYMKLRDAQKAATDFGHEPLVAQMQPLPLDEAQKILQRHTDQGKLRWSPTGDKQWKRSDGAMAALKSNGLSIATAEIWPRIRLRD